MIGKISMTSQVEKWIRDIIWLGTEHQVPGWVERGIQHGFEGLGFDLPQGSFSLKQVHGTSLVEVTRELNGTSLTEGDGLWTQTKGLIIAVKTADCVPILIQHPKLVMALHAGWKGMAQDIIGKGLAVLEARGIPLSECQVAIGSCISLDSFEVGPELIASFKQGAYGLDDDTLAWSASKGIGDRWHLDLALLAALRFLKAGALSKGVAVVRSCTKKNPMVWHSFRRDGERAGRNWSWIRL